MEEAASYGSNFYKNISEDLKSIFPAVRSFSVTNLRYMKYYYELFCENENRPQTGDKLKSQVS